MNSEIIAKVLGEELDLDPETLTLSPSSTGKFNETWFVNGSDSEQRWVIRIAPPEDRSKMLFYEHCMMRQESAIHRQIREQTACPVPKILVYRPSDRRLNDRDFLIMERLPGKPLADFRENTLEELGLALRDVHGRIRAQPKRYGYLGEHRPMAPEPTWQAAFRSMWHALLDDIRECDGYSDGEDGFFRSLLDREIHRFDHYHASASLLHMDVWAENILADSEGKLTGLIDWDRACWGDPEIEFAILDYCGISSPGFWRGYASSGQDPRAEDSDAAVRRIFYLLYEVQKYIVIRIARNGNPSGAERYRRMALSLADQLR